MKNKRLSGGDDFQVKLVGPGGFETHADLQDKEDGTYIVTFCATAAGTHDVHVTIGEPTLVFGIEWQQHLDTAVLLWMVKPVICH